MKSFYNKLQAVFVTILCLWAIQTNAQLQVNSSVTANALANQIVGTGVTISNVNLDCAPGAYGVFTNGNTTNIGLTNGVLLTTGSANDAIGPNTDGGTTVNNPSAYNGHSGLDPLTPWSIQDACALSFDFVAESDFITVQYAFASEEYNEYVCSQFNDIFAFFVSGPNPLGGNYNNTNLALVPNTTLPVSVNSINNGNSGQFGDNDNCIALNNSAHYINNNSGLTIGYDGFTVTLTAQVAVVPGQSYSFEFAIADISDSSLDSGVFIKGSSFSIFLCQAGTVSFANPNVGNYYCTQDLLSDVFQVVTNAISTSDFYEFLLTDLSGNILQKNTTGLFDLNSYGVASFNIYGLSYSGEVTGIAVGNNISDISAVAELGCFELSNALPIEGRECDIPPVLECPADLELTCLDIVPAPNDASAVLLSEGCSASSIIWDGDEFNGNSCEYTITRTYASIDECGNIGTCAQEIHVVDNIAPTAENVPANVTFACGTDVPTSVDPIFSDVCNEVNFTREDVIVDLACGYEVHRTWTVTDLCGNTSEFVQVLTAIDTTAPSFAPVQPYIHVACDQVANLPLPTATDACSDVTVTFTETLNSGGCLGVLQRIYTATDACGNTATVTQFISIQDNVGPVISNPADATVECDVAPTQIPSIEIYDACGYDVTILEASQEIITIDACTYQIVWHWEAMDYCDNVSEATTTITVVDTTVPVITLQGEDATYNCDEPFTAPASALVSDNCVEFPSLELNIDTIAGNCANNYQIVYTWTANDMCGNVSEASITYTIQDITAPVFSENNQVQFQYECDVVIPVITPFAADACSDITLTHEDVQQWSEGCTSGFVRTWTATDACGNYANFSQYIQVVDTTAPAIVGELELSIPCDNREESYVTVSDNCNLFDVSINDDLVSGSCAGRIIRIYTATDICGNTSQFTQILNLIDNTLPVANNEVANLTLECGQMIPSFDPAFSDNCDETLETTFNQESEFSNNGCTETITQTWTATDHCNNTLEIVRVITINDTTAPTFNELPENTTIQCGTLIPTAYVSAYDICAGEVIATFNDEIIEGNCDASYTIVRTWTAVDNCGNDVQHVQYITVVDTNAPTFGDSNQSYFTFECNTPYELPQPVATDLCSEITYSSEQGNSWVDGCATGYSVVWTATDACGNSSNFTQYIQIVDTTAPSIEGDAVITVECDQLEDYYITFTDNCNETESSFSDVIVTGSCNGTIIRTYVVSDICGNESIFTQAINLIDSTFPTIAVQPENITVECGDDYPAFIPEFSDNCDEDLSFSAISNIGFDEELCGDLISQSWSATDNCGNTTTVSRIITIVDTTNPYFTETPMSYSVSCEDAEEIIFDQASAGDVCDNEVTVDANNVIIPGNCPGNYVIERTYTATDDCGNFVNYVQTITVFDNAGPDFTFVPENATVSCLEFDGFESATATDACSGATITFLDTVVPFTQEGTNDDCGQFTTFSQGGWGAPNGTAANYRDENFADAFPNGLTVGCGDNTYTFTNAQAIENFLPAGGPSSLISGASTNPTGVQNQLASQLVAASLSIGFDAYDADFGDSEGSLGSLVFNSGAFEGMTISQVVNQANLALGGCSSAFSLNALASAMEVINLNYHEGDEDNGNFSCGSESLCGELHTRTWTATDACGNTTNASATIFVYDNVAPTFETELTDVVVECASEIPAAVEVTATDVCSDVFVSTEIEEVTGSDDCGNQILYVHYTATDNCGNMSETGYYITVLDETNPTFESCPENLVIDCTASLPEPAVLVATDNCDNDVTVTYTQTLYGNIPAEGSISDCRLLTPVRPANNPCNYAYDWAMALFGMPTQHRYYAVTEGNLVRYPDGTVHVTAVMNNAMNNANGWNVDVWFNNQMDWNEWSSQSFPTSFKADCGASGVNHEEWLYFILVNGEGAELTGFGDYEGSTLNLGHAPSNKYFGFQLGDGANNYNAADNGFGGWFTYSGLFLVNEAPFGNQQGSVSGAGDFAFELDCCPDYYAMRRWTATDCSGNQTVCEQMISFSDLSVDEEEVLSPETPAETVKEDNTVVVSVYPNPAENNATFTLVSSESNRTTLEIFDITGAKVASVFSSIVEENTEYKISVDVRTFATGIYTFRVTSGNHIEQGKLVISK
ncbi:MAG: choice-of-anchor L domain-containing protein [Flavobacteriales bacterium]